VKTAFAVLIVLSCHFCDAAQGSSADDLLKQAVSLASSGRMDDAEQLLLEGMSRFADDPRFPIELAGVAWRRTQPGRAKSYLRQALRLDPAATYANEFLGSLYLLDGNLFAALEYLNRVRRPVLSRVILSPEPPLRPELLARLPAVSAGQLLTEARIAQTEHNLERLRIFGEPRFELVPEGDEYRLTIHAPVLSSPLSGIAGRLLPLLRGLPYQSVNIDWLNIGRSARNLTSLWRWDPDKRRIAITYRAPIARGTYAIWTDLRNENWQLSWSGPSPENIDVKSASLNGEIEFDLGGGKQWTPSFHLSRHTFRHGLSQPLFANSTVWEVRNRFDFPRWRYPERRLHIDSSVTMRSGRVFSRSSSRLLGAEFASDLRWLPQSRGDTYTVGARLRAGAFTGRLPIDQLYMTAMERDNDLWIRGHAGTRHGRKGSAPVGSRFAMAQLEIARQVFRIPFLRVDAGPFLDVANVGGKAALGSRGWLYDTGVEAAITALGRFRFTVVYGRDLRRGDNVFYTALSR
jgi:hypothetical protein